MEIKPKADCECHEITYKPDAGTLDNCNSKLPKGKVKVKTEVIVKMRCLDLR